MKKVFFVCFPKKQVSYFLLLGIYNKRTVLNATKTQSSADSLQLQHPPQSGEALVHNVVVRPDADQFIKPGFMSKLKFLALFSETSILVLLAIMGSEKKYWYYFRHIESTESLAK